MLEERGQTAAGDGSGGVIDLAVRRRLAKLDTILAALEAELLAAIRAQEMPEAAANAFAERAGARVVAEAERFYGRGG